MGPPEDTKFATPWLDEERLPGFHAAMSDSYAQISRTCCELVNAIEEGLGAPPSCLSGPTAAGQGAELNLNFYPEVERDMLEDKLDTLEMEGKGVARSGDDPNLRRIWPHSDLGVVSALFQDGIGETGLEVQLTEPHEAKFAPVSIEKEGDLVLLVSDTLERWTNGRLRAAVHRVGLPPSISHLNPTSKSQKVLVPERRSAVMFFRAPPTVDLYPVSHFISEENPARYECITAGEYLKRHNKKLY
jgi:isopenicillin N synthase-like dioxygenase